MAFKHWIMGGMLLACTSARVEASLVLTWEFPHQLGPQPWYLTIVQIASGETTLQTRTLAALDDARCRQIVGAGYVEGESWCAVLDCPGSGAYHVTLQAREESPPSDPLALGVQTPPCAVIDYDEAVTVAVPPPLPPPVPLATPLSPAPPPVVADTTPPAAPAPTQHTPVTRTTSPPAPAARKDPGPPPIPRPAPAAPAPTLFGDVTVPAMAETEVLTSARFVEAFAELARRYGKAMEQLATDYDAVYDDVLAHPSPAGQRRLVQLYEQAVARQQQIYAQATQAWERLYAAWQQFILTPPSHQP